MPSIKDGSIVFKPVKGLDDGHGGMPRPEGGFGRDALEVER
ncbi:hypothetical protein ABENE_23125 [Asticcacaulis benevestitus DSM 16100 = ATCC BAA-896]|uniref:Uncharacterized protein n=1 Tax=Asticcacaulis benevestitus DSM 16100 = ATCC BAA-896 TaxID=1121022 RepID=V4NZ77_9CAUL|nr:hypothetical protein ABENE_23125 [Asticcacaulis benevestitus DSM 16100 = ATCC BAA-896]